MKVLLGVCGSIAAYKSVEILRALQTHGAEVDVALTRSARRFVTPLTFAALTGKPVFDSLWQPSAIATPDAPIDHIAIAQAIDVLLVAPATADTLSRLARGAANDFLSATYLATTAPVVLAPAMNVNMWQHPATQANLDLLRSRGALIVEPEAGYLACGMIGSGRLAEVDQIVDLTLGAPGQPRDLTGETVMVTAGGTREAIDAVRFLGNRSSGRMGHALAAAAQARGATVLLITASSLPSPAGCEVLRVETAQEMGEAIDQHLPRTTVLIAAAAVADFRPAAPFAGKLRRTERLHLDLEPTPDLVARAVAQRRNDLLVIAFAAEMEDVQANAQAKLLRKGVDAIVANDISAAGIGFDSESNAGWWITPEQTVDLPRESKRRLADRILDKVLALRARQHASPQDPRFAQALLPT